MEKIASSPWTWQDARSYVQAVEVKQVESTLYCAGQAAVDADGISSRAGMREQLEIAIANVEKVIAHAGFACAGIVRLNVYTVSAAALMENFDVLQAWLNKHGIQQSTSLIEVKGLFETLQVELEATVVK
ncbi:RidA family protein [Sphingobacterium bambusae]|uniref:RidA family protein n=1 Tax=Sphingobacterium bambusae TaxID=662858 RepID=A0ABW6BPD9_9SPHI|nr:RidA family protein [Sphingobacterium bambusae]WPL49876.1 RidA family protein [Sphingobacterium bambusae]